LDCVCDPQVKTRPSTREVVAIHTLEEVCIEVVITLPQNYPLGNITVSSEKKVGVTAQQWDKWLLQLNIFLQHQVKLDHINIFLQHQVKLDHTNIFQQHQVKLDHTNISQQHQVKLDHTNISQQHQVKLGHTNISIQHQVER
jgi:hypothetical protein